MGRRVVSRFDVSVQLSAFGVSLLDVLPPVHFIRMDIFFVLSNVLCLF